MSDRGPADALLLDEMFSPSIAEALRSDGFDVVAVTGHAILAAAPLAATEPPLRVPFTSSRRFPRSRHNPGPLLQALRRWLHDGVERAAAEWPR